MALLLLPAVLAVSVANGANDNAKGVATLLGGRTTTTRTAIAWGTAATLAGALLSAVTGARLAAAFTGGGLLPPATAATPALMTSVGLGAAMTVGFAARLGLPVSTTHALLGALAGAGGVAAHGQLSLGTLGLRFAAPLLVSPLAAAALVATVYPLASRARRRLGITPTSCMCLGHGTAALATPAGALRLAALPVLHRCKRRYEGTVLGLDAQRVATGAHVALAGLQSFARGMNDTPKIAALLLAAGATAPSTSAAFVAVALAMAAGGWFGARRVGETIGYRITEANEGQALTASAATASLVLAASAFALPVSMTHVAVGSLAGIGWATGNARWETLRSIAGAWFATLPLAAACGAVFFLLAERIMP